MSCTKSFGVVDESALLALFCSSIVELLLRGVDDGTTPTYFMTMPTAYSPIPPVEAGFDHEAFRLFLSHCMVRSSPRMADSAAVLRPTNWGNRGTPGRCGYMTVDKFLTVRMHTETALAVAEVMLLSMLGSQARSTTATPSQSGPFA